MILKNKKDIQRFLNNFEKRKGNECWIWNGPIRKGHKKYRTVTYGRMGVNSTLQLAHRLSYDYHKGLIPSGLFVCHTCDTHLCVNPNHLYLGDANSNNKDKTGKGYISRRKINEAMKRYRDGDKVKEICEAIGISHSTLWRCATQRNIIRRKRNL